MVGNEMEFYPTPARLTEILLERFVIGYESIIYEPCAGDGAMASVLAAAGHTVFTNDLDDHWPADTHLDATKDEAWEHWIPGPHWVVTNPPFSQAPEILRRAYDVAQVGVAFLLRLSFLEPCGPQGGNRGPWLAEHAGAMTRLIIFGQPRPSFTGDGKTDSVTSAWMVWEKAPNYEGCRPYFVYDWQEEEGEGPRGAHRS